MYCIPTPQLASRCVQRRTHRILMLNETSKLSVTHVYLLFFCSLSLFA